jgi:transcriptional regulator with XRE-family HTH domain
MFAVLTDRHCACDSACRVDEGAIYKAFGRAVAQRRRAIPKTQEQVAREIGLSRASLANIERGSQKVFLHQILALTKALELESAHEIVPTKAAEPAKSPRDEVRFSGAKDLSKKQKAFVTSLVSSLSKSQDRK